MSFVQIVKNSGVLKAVTPLWVLSTFEASIVKEKSNFLALFFISGLTKIDKYVIIMLSDGKAESR